MAASLKEYLKDPLLKSLWDAVRQAGPIRSVSLDLTHVCNLRCKGCYYFEEGMDNFYTKEAEKALDEWIKKEKDRGTNFVTIVGGEPSLALNRLKKVYDNFKVSVATNGLRKIPFKGFEHLPIGVAVWGNFQTDNKLRGSNKIEVFKTALVNYKDDPRAFWYYTVAPGLAHEIEEVVSLCVANGNPVLFNYYSDLGMDQPELDYRGGFKEVHTTINKMIEKYPNRILTTSYLNKVVTSGNLFGEQWGYEVCTNLSEIYPGNSLRFKNGKPYNVHFRAYNADYKTTRRCCTGIDRNCASCFDTWEHFSWIMINAKKHLGSKLDFSRWLTSVYVFYFLSGFVSFEKGLSQLPKIHQQLKAEKLIPQA